MRRPFSPRRAPALLALTVLTALAALPGCGRSVVTTEIGPDGAWKRTVKLYGNMPAKPGQPAGGPQASGMTIADTFAPPKGPEWTVTRGPEEAEKKKKPGAKPDPAEMGNPFAPVTEVYTAVRALAAGETLKQDVAVKMLEGKQRVPRIVNEVTVRQIAPNRYEYREVVRWSGPNRPPLAGAKELGEVDKELLAELKKRLPPELATPDKVKVLQEKLLGQVWRVMMGPNEPLVAEIFGAMLFPDALLRKMTRRLGGAFDRALAETYGESLSEEKRLAIARALAQSQSEQFKDQAEKKTKAGPPGLGGPGGEDGKAGEDGNLIAMTFAVKLPGKIVEANGEIDPIMNEVYWTFYSPAVLAGDVEMRAVCEVKPGAAARGQTPDGRQAARREAASR